jgi:ADP-heptose:LPS heptosyltransferase
MALRIGIVSTTTDLGVMVVRSLLIKLLREHHRDARLILLAESADLPIVREFHESLSWIDECVAIGTERPRETPELFAVVRQVRALNLDVIILNPWSRFPAVIPYWCGIPVRAGLPRDDRARQYLTHPVRLADLASPDAGEAPPRDLHWVAVHEGYARALHLHAYRGPAAHVPFLRLAHPPGRGRAARPLVVVHAGGSPDWNRRWPRDRFARVCCTAVERHGASIVLIGSAHERADNGLIADEVMRACPSADIADRSGCAIAETAAIVAAADLFVGNDSGPMNVAVAVGTPVVAVRGADPENFRADLVDPGHIVLSNWAGCARRASGSEHCDRGCPVAYDREAQQYPRCMAAITLEQVLEAMARQLARRDASLTAAAATGHGGERVTHGQHQASASRSGR